MRIPAAVSDSIIISLSERLTDSLSDALKESISDLETDSDSERLSDSDSETLSDSETDSDSEGLRDSETDSDSEAPTLSDSTSEADSDMLSESRNPDSVSEVSSLVDSEPASLPSSETVSELFPDSGISSDDTDSVSSSSTRAALVDSETDTDADVLAASDSAVFCTSNSETGVSLAVFNVIVSCPMSVSSFSRSSSSASVTSGIIRRPPAKAPAATVPFIKDCLILTDLTFEATSCDSSVDSTSLRIIKNPVIFDIMSYQTPFLRRCLIFADSEVTNLSRFL